MGNVSNLDFTGLRIGTLGTLGSLAVAAPLGELNPAVEANTDASRIGWYFSRIFGSEKIGTVVMGVEVLSIFEDRVEVLGDEVWHAGNLTPGDYQLTSQKGVANGYAGLDAGGLVPRSQLPFWGLTYIGTWNASTNTPSLTSSTGTAGNYYVVSTAGSTALDGISTWAVGDWVIFNGSVWQKINNNQEYKVLASGTDATPGYLNAKVDGVTITVNGSDQLAVLSVPSAASAVTVDTTNLNKILGSSDSDVQTALETLDDHTHPVTDISEVTYTGYVSLTTGVYTTVDTATSGTAFKWLINMRNATGDHVAVEILGAVIGTTDIDYQVYSPTNNRDERFDFDVNVTHSLGTTTLQLYTDTGSIEASVYRFTMA